MTPQLTALATHWPMVYGALTETYYTDSLFGETSEAGENDCGYILQGLAKYERHASTAHAHRGISHAALDRAAAREIYYQHGRQRVFRRACAVLCTCWQRLVTERPERLFAAMAIERRQNEKK